MLNQEKLLRAMEAENLPDYSESETAIYRSVASTLEAIEHGDRTLEKGLENLATMLCHRQADRAELRLVLEDLFDANEEEVQQLIDQLAMYGYGRKPGPSAAPPAESAGQLQQVPEGGQVDGPRKPILPRGYLGRFVKDSGTAAVLFGDRLVICRLLKAILEDQLRLRLQRKPDIKILDFQDADWNGFEAEFGIVSYLGFDGDTPIAQTTAALESIYKELEVRRATCLSTRAGKNLLGHDSDFPPKIVIVNGLADLDDEISLFYTPLEKRRDPALTKLRRQIKDLLLIGPKYGISFVVGTSSRHDASCLLPKSILSEAPVAFIGGPDGDGNRDYRAVDRVVSDRDLLPNADDRNQLQSVLFDSRTFDLGVILIPASPPLFGALDTHKLQEFDRANLVPYLSVLLPFKV